jgi:2-polyprenyl-3-methyl-5-hydroxy-6-metoxy-1,4-benzoquinol methylase
MSGHYSEYSWASTDPSNGDAGVGLADVFIKSLSRAGFSGRRICDLGCGNGYLASRLSALGYDVTGIDASASGIAMARRNNPQARFHCLTISENVPQEIGERDFDAVVSSDVIEHLYRPAELLEVANSLLAPKGHLIIGTPYHGYWKNLALSLAGRMDAHFSPLWDGGHIKFFSVVTLTELVRLNGFIVERFSFYGRAPWLWKNMVCHARKVGE